MVSCRPAARLEGLSRGCCAAQQVEGDIGPQLIDAASLALRAERTGDPIDVSEGGRRSARVEVGDHQVGGSVHGRFEQDLPPRDRSLMSGRCLLRIGVDGHPPQVTAELSRGQPTGHGEQLRHDGLGRPLGEVGDAVHDHRSTSPVDLTAP